MKRYLHTILFGIVILLTTVSVSFADVEQIDNRALEILIAEGVPVVDVRRIDEWQATGIINGVHTLTFFDEKGRYDAERWLEAFNNIAPKGTPVVLICAAGVRSKSIAELLDKRLGYSGVHNHTTGMNDWIKAGNPVIKYVSETSHNEDRSE